MQTFSESDLYEIYYQSYKIPIGIFDCKGNLLKLYLDGGQRLTELYLADSRRLLNRVREESGPLLTFDLKGSGWGVFPMEESVILIGPAQTGHNPNYPFYNVPEYSWDIFGGVVRSFACFLLGKQTNVKETRELFRETERSRQLFENIDGEKKAYNAYNELYDSIRSGDLQTLQSILNSDELNEYLDCYMKTLPESRMVFNYSSIKAFHTAQNVCGNTDELMEIAKIYRKAVAQSRSKNACRSGMKSMLYDYAVLVSRYRNGRYSAGINKALNYISENLYTKITVEEVARSCAMGVSTLEHAFKAETGKSVTDMIRERKIQKACYFLKYTRIPCGDVAAKLGYCSTSVFITRFKQEMGMTPGEYRKKGK